MYGALTCGTCKACREGRDNLCENVAGIMGFHVDGFARELINMPARLVIPVPAGVTLRDAACAPIAFSTVEHMLFDNAKLQPGETILVHAGGSGIGTAAIKMAKAIGCTVITTVGDDAKAEKAKALGADHVINYRTDRFEGVVRKLTAKKGVDVVFEHIGAETFTGSLLSLKRGGRLVTCGSTSGPTVTLNLMQLFQQQYKIFGSFGASMRNIRDSLDKMADGLLPVIDTEVPLAESGARPGTAREPAGVRQDHREVLSRGRAGRCAMHLRRLGRRLRGRLKPAVDAAAGRTGGRPAEGHPAAPTASGSATSLAAFMRTVGPWLPEHRIGRANLARRLSGKVGRRDRAHSARRVGQSRPRRRRVRPSRPHLQRRSGEPRLHRLRPGDRSSASTGCATTASRR